MSDPVADKSRFLCMYMSNHPDTLVSYAKHFGNIQEHVVGAKMESIDSKGMTLSCQTKSHLSSKQTVHVAFDPPLMGYDEVKPRLLGMKVDADEALGTAKAPQITSFRFPFKAYQTLVPILLLIYTTYAPENDTTSVWVLGRVLKSTVGGPLTLRWIWTFAITVHASEGIYAALLTRKHQMPLLIAILYISAISLFGFPVLLDLRKRIQDARIESIMKGQ